MLSILPSYLHGLVRNWFTCHFALGGLGMGITLAFFELSKVIVLQTSSSLC